MLDRHLIRIAHWLLVPSLSTNLATFHYHYYYYYYYHYYHYYDDY